MSVRPASVRARRSRSAAAARTRGLRVLLSATSATPAIFAGRSARGPAGPATQAQDVAAGRRQPQLAGGRGTPEVLAAERGQAVAVEARGMGAEEHEARPVAQQRGEVVEQGREVRVELPG